MARNRRAEEHLRGGARAICELMHSYGITKTSAKSILQEALSEGFAGSIRQSKDASRIAQLADVCARWHFEKDYVDALGQPIPLRWNGRSGSLLELAKRVVGKRGSREVVHELIARRLVRKNSQTEWLPKSKVVSPHGPDATQVLRSATMLERLLRTILHNSHRKYKGDVLLEVMARVPRLPSEQVANFKRFAKAHGVSFIQTIDDWLESRTVRATVKRGARTREVGVVAFAFVDPPRRNK